MSNKLTTESEAKRQAAISKVLYEGFSIKIVEECFPLQAQTVKFDILT